MRRGQISSRILVVEVGRSRCRSAVCTVRERLKDAREVAALSSGWEQSFHSVGSVVSTTSAVTRGVNQGARICTPVGDEILILRSCELVILSEGCTETTLELDALRVTVCIGYGPVAAKEHILGALTGEGAHKEECAHGDARRIVADRVCEEVRRIGCRRHRDAGDKQAAGAIRIGLLSSEKTATPSLQRTPVVTKADVLASRLVAASSRCCARVGCDVGKAAAIEVVSKRVHKHVFALDVGVELIGPVANTECGRVVVVVVHVDQLRSRDLLSVAENNRLLCGSLSLCEDWEEDSCEDSDDRDNDQELDESECLLHIKPTAANSPRPVESDSEMLKKKELLF